MNLIWILFPQKMPRNILPANSLRQAPCFLKSKQVFPLWRREPDAVPSSQTWPMQKTATMRRPELSSNDHLTVPEYKVKCEPSLYIKISRRRLLVLPVALRDIFYTVWLSDHCSTVDRTVSIYIDFRSAISAIFASFRRVSPWTRL